MWSTVAKIAAPIIIDKGIDLLTGNNTPSTKTNPAGLSPRQIEMLRQSTQNAGVNPQVGNSTNNTRFNARFLDENPGWEVNTSGRFSTPDGDIQGIINQTQSGYSNTRISPNDYLNASQYANQGKPGIYNDLLRPVVRETGGQLAKEAVGYFTGGDLGPLLSAISSLVKS